MAPGIPPLAGLASREEAARVGLSVEECVRRLVRCHWMEEGCRRMMVARIPATPEWEVKGALALHQWLAAEHSAALRRRISEMRSPPPRLDAAPEQELDVFLEQVGSASDTRELLTGLYAVLLPALAEAYQRHLHESNVLVDHPSRRVVAANLREVRDAIDWGDAALAALGGEHAPFREHLDAYLEAAGGPVGDADRAAPPPPRTPWVPDFEPRRDERFGGLYNFNFPPHNLYASSEVPAAERNLALLCKRLLEMDVPEMMASFLAEREGQPADFYADYGRQLWDEARHSMMGEVALAARGVDWTRLPLNVGFALRLNLYAEPRERQILLWAIEQSLMPGETGKRLEHRTAREAGDALSVHFHDYDWADEVLHARIGRRWLLGDQGEGLSFQDAMAAGRAIHERTWSELAAYRGREPQTDWWADFVREVLGTETAATTEQRSGDPTIVTEPHRNG